MDLRKLKTILELFEESTCISELEISEGEDRVRLRKGGAETTVPVVPSSATAIPAPSVATAEVPAEKGVAVTSPMVGAFYRASSPEVPPFVRVGQMVETGQTLCIIEAMKLMNEIPSTVSGKVVGILPENGAAVGYGDTLFIIE